MWANPKPDNRVGFKYSYCSPIEIDASRVDGQAGMNLLESERRVRRILLPEAIGTLDTKLALG